MKNQTDLMLVFAVTLLTLVFVLLPPLNETPIRIILGLTLVLFLPGYSLISALFPKKKDLGAVERIALSFGLSIAVTPLIGLILNYTPFGIRQTPSLIALAAFTIICTTAAYIRRSKIDEKERFTPQLTYKPTLPEKKTDRILTIVLILSILAATSAVIYVIVTPKEGEKFTEFYILGPERMADNYPTNLKIGENGTVIVGIVNHEYTPTNYTLRVELDDEPLKQIPLQLNHNQTREYNITFSPTRNGTQKLVFLLHRDDLGEPYRTLHLWVRVSE